MEHEVAGFESGRRDQEDAAFVTAAVSLPETFERHVCDKDVVGTSDFADVANAL
jgi:hypothetical protein